MMLNIFARAMMTASRCETLQEQHDCAAYPSLNTRNAPCDSTNSGISSQATKLQSRNSQRSIFGLDEHRSPSDKG